MILNPWEDSFKHKKRRIKGLGKLPKSPFGKWGEKVTFHRENGTL